MEVDSLASLQNLNKDVTFRLGHTNNACVCEMAAGVINKGATTMLAAKKALPTSGLALAS